MNTDTEVAEKVMGWEYTWPQSSPGDHFSARGDYFKWEAKPLYRGGGIDVDDWRPTQNIKQAFRVVERMRRLGWQYLVWCWVDGKGFVEFKKPVKHDLRSFTDFGTERFGDESEIPMATCKAALAAMEA